MMRWMRWMRWMRSGEFALFFSILVLAACARESEAPTDAVDEAVPAANRGPEIATVPGSDGVPIVYESRGAGDTAVVLVHCWACNREFWREQVEPLAEAGYRVVTLDLPGHGDSGSDRDVWDVDELGADVVAVVDALDLQRLVLVGHSMGGPVSLAAASRLPGRALGVTCVDTLHHAEFEWPEGLTETIARPLEEDYRAGMEAFVPQLFKEGVDPELVEWVIDQAVERTDPAATVALMRAYSDWDAPAALAAAGVPIRCINAAPEGGEGFPTEIEVNRRYADFDATLMEGVGHYPHLERPAEFNVALLAALSELTAPR